MQALFSTLITVGAGAIIISIVRIIIMQHHKHPKPIYYFTPEAEVDRRVHTWGAMNDNNFEI